jgi:hypothetical protein
MIKDIASGSAWRQNQLVDLAWELSQAAEELISAPRPISDGPLFALWQAVRHCTDEWQRRLQQFVLKQELAPAGPATQNHLPHLEHHPTPSSVGGHAEGEPRPDLQTLGVEILLADLLLRVWGTILAAQDRQRGVPVARPIMEHVLYAIHYSRSRLLEWVMHGGEAAASIDRFRRRCERWTDALIGPILARYGTSLFAHNPRRAWEFGEEQLGAATAVAQLQRAGIRAAFGESVLFTPLSRHWTDILQALLDGCDPDVVNRRLGRWRHGPPSCSVCDAAAFRHSEANDWSLLARCLHRVHQRERAG